MRVIQQESEKSAFLNLLFFKSFTLGFSPKMVVHPKHKSSTFYHSSLVVSSHTDSLFIYLLVISYLVYSFMLGFAISTTEIFAPNLIQ